VTSLKALAASLAGLLVVPMLFIAGITGSFGAARTAAPSSGTEAIGFSDRAQLQRAVLTDPAIHLTAPARHDVESGRVDPRILAVLLVLARAFDLGPVGPLITGHTYFVKGTTRVSNHVFGRAVDILGVDGAPVSPANQAARQLMQQTLSLSSPLLPDEVGGPWIVHVGPLTSFTDADHQDHVHIGYDR
jgi:hypothetical protein